MLTFGLTLNGLEMLLYTNLEIMNSVSCLLFIFRKLNKMYIQKFLKVEHNDELLNTIIIFEKLNYNTKLL